MQRIVRGPEGWAGLSALHLTAAQKRFSQRVKEDLVAMQKGKRRVVATYEDGHFPRKYYVDTLSHLREFIGDCLDIVDKGPTVIVLDTRGHSDRWEKGRREIDGVRFRKNEDSSGVTAILMKLHVRGEVEATPYPFAGKGPMAMINVQKILERELGGKPSLPPISSVCFNTRMRS